MAARCSRPYPLIGGSSVTWLIIIGSGQKVFVFESRCIIHPTRFAMECPQLQPDYYKVWQRLKKNFRL
ncbi:MAG TPA: hypothetical protein DEA22_06885 [Blastocatellia bacterium]|nr:hypothetical protein [Blastocatellia bacterium]